MEGEGFGFGFGSGDLAFLRGWFAWLVGWCGIRNQGSFCWIALLLLLPLPLPCFVAGVVGRVFGSRGKRGESASSKIVLAPLECLTIYTLHPAGER